MDIREVMGADLADAFYSAIEKGKELHQSYVRDRLVNCSVPVTEQGCQ